MFVVALDELLQIIVLNQNALLRTPIASLHATCLVFEVVMVDGGFDFRNCILSRANSFWTIWEGRIYSRWCMMEEDGLTHGHGAQDRSLTLFSNIFALWLTMPRVMTGLGLSVLSRSSAMFGFASSVKDACVH